VETPKTREPTVFVVDDDDAVRTMVGRLIASVGLCVETYGTAEEFLAAYKPSRPGCLVLDVRMPGMSGLELQDKLAANHIGLPIVFLTGYGDVPMAVHCLQEGAVHFIEKPFREQALLDAVHKALEQDRQRREEQARRADARARLASLTDREQDVLRLVVAGKANKEIAAELGVSIKAIEAHRTRILSKMKVRRTVDLVRAVVLAGPV